MADIVQVSCCPDCFGDKPWWWYVADRTDVGHKHMSDDYATEAEAEQAACEYAIDNGDLPLYPYGDLDGCRGEWRKEEERWRRFREQVAVEVDDRLQQQEAK